MKARGFIWELSVASLSGWLCSLVYFAFVGAAIMLDGYGINIATRGSIPWAKLCVERLGYLLLAIECLSIALMICMRSGKLIRSVCAAACFVLVQVASIGVALFGQPGLLDSGRRLIQSCVCRG
jgi:hypothetical protein